MSTVYENKDTSVTFSDCIEANAALTCTIAYFEKAIGYASKCFQARYPEQSEAYVKRMHEQLHALKKLQAFLQK